MKTRIVARQLVTADGEISPGKIEFDDGLIAAITRVESSATPDVDILMPGFVDLHCHGGGGGTFGIDDPADIARVHRQHGTTTVVASLVTAPHEALQHQVSELAQAVEAGAIAGIHLEGPWLSPTFKGAHPEEFLQFPSIEKFEELWDASRGTIVAVTVAPELPGANKLIERLKSLGVIAAIGHSAANAQETISAVESGAAVVTHAFNAVKPIHHREESLMNVALTDPRLTCELILDGIHLSARTIDLVLKSAPDHWIAVSDAMAAAGKGDGHFTVGGAPTTVAHGVARLDDSGAVAGSTLTMDKAFARLRTEHCLSNTEIAAALSSRPAKLLRRDDIGQLRVGMRADAVALDLAGRVSHVWHKGQLTHE